VWVLLPCTAGAGLPYPSPPLLAANLQVLIELTFGGQQEPRRQYQWPFTLVYYPLRVSGFLCPCHALQKGIPADEARFDREVRVEFVRVPHTFWILN